jgi:ribose 5-phosphate isomerase A
MASPGATGRKRSASLTDRDRIEEQKRVAATAAAELVQDGMRVGLGSGSTVAYLLPAIAARGCKDVRCVATSPDTEHDARALGLHISKLEDVGELDLAIDGADQVDDECWLIKGGGGAHTREKIVAAAARRFVVIVSHEKVVSRVGPPVPLELLRFGLQRTLAALAPSKLRDVPPSPDGGLIADYYGPIEDPRELAERLSCTPGLIDHGLFGPEMVSTVLIAGESGVKERTGAKDVPR